MASFSQHCEKTGSEKLIQFSQSFDALPTLHVVATFGQWYPEELDQSSFHVDDDMTLNNCSPQLSTEKPVRRKVLSSQQQRLSSTSAGKSEVSYRKKELLDVCARSHQQQPKLDSSQTVRSSSVCGRLPSAVRSEKSSGSRSAKISRSRTVEDGRRHRSSGSHGTKACSAESAKLEAFARDEQSCKDQPKRSGGWKSVRRSNASTASCSECVTELGFETFTADDTVTLFQSAAAAVNRHAFKAGQRTAERDGSEWIDFTETIAPLLVWSYVPAAGASECYDNLPASTHSCDSIGGRGHREALVERIVYGGTERLEHDFPDCENMTSAQNLLTTESDTGDNVLVGNTCENLVSSHYGRNSVKSDHTVSSVLNTDNNHLQTEVGNSMKEKCCKTPFSHRRRSSLNGSMAGVSNLKPRRCWSASNLRAIADAAGTSLARPTDSAGAVLHAVCACCWFSESAACACAGRVDKGALLRSSRASVVDCYLPARTCRSDAPLTDASHLPLTGTDRAESRRAPAPTVGSDWQAGALCFSGQHLQSSRVVVGGGAPGGLATDAAESAGMSRPPLCQSAALPLGMPRPRRSNSIPATGSRTPPAGSAVHSASYFASAPAARSCPVVGGRYCWSDAVMGLVESSADTMHKNPTTTAAAEVESVDISSTLSVSVRARADLDVDGTTTDRQPGGSGPPRGWNSLLNPAQIGGAAADLRPTSGDASSDDGVPTRDCSASSSNDGVEHVTLGDTLGCSAPPSADSRSQLNAARPPAVDDGAVGPIDATGEAGGSSKQRDVRAADERAHTDDASCSDSSDKGGPPGVDCTGDGDDDTGGRRSGVAVDEALRYRGGESNGPGPPPLPRSDHRPDDRVTREEAPANADDDSVLTARDAGVAADSGRQLTPDTAVPPPQQHQNPPGALSHVPSSDLPRSPAVEQLSPVSNVERGRVETDLGGETGATMAAASDDVTGPPRCLEEAGSSDMNDDLLTHDDSGVKSDSRPLSTGTAPDDDDVDRKLADELERLKSLIVSSPKTSTTLSQSDNFMSTVAGPEEAFTADLNDADDLGFSSNNNKLSLRHLSADEIPEDTAESQLEFTDLESAFVVEQQLQGADYLPVETARTGLHVNHRDSPVTGQDSRLGAETADNYADDVVRSTDPSMDSLYPAASALEHLQAVDKVSSIGPSNVDGLASSMYHTSPDHTEASTVQRSLLQANTLSSADTMYRELKSATSNVLVDVIHEAERNLFLFFEIPDSTSCSCVSTSRGIRCRRCSQDSQTFVSDTNKTRESVNQKLLKGDQPCAVSSCIRQNCSLEFPKYTCLGDRNPNLLIKGTLGHEGMETNEMTLDELKVMREMLYAERLLIQLHGASLHLQVAYPCQVGVFITVYSLKADGLYQITCSL